MLHVALDASFILGLSVLWAAILSQLDHTEQFTLDWFLNTKKGMMKLNGPRQNVRHVTMHR